MVNGCGTGLLRYLLLLLLLNAAVETVSKKPQIIRIRYIVVVVVVCRNFCCIIIWWLWWLLLLRIYEFQKTIRLHRDEMLMCEQSKTQNPHKKELNSVSLINRDYIFRLYIKVMNNFRTACTHIICINILCLHFFVWLSSSTHNLNN